jgi:hypothetical protein
VETPRRKSLFVGSQVTDGLGQVVFPVTGLTEGTMVIVHLHYNGESDIASAETSFLYRVPDPTPAVLTVLKYGSGRVLGPGIDCGSACVAKFAYGSRVSLVAQPEIGWFLSSWSGACTGTGSCALTMSDSASVTATFSPEPVNRRALTVRLTRDSDPGCPIPAEGLVVSTPPGLVCQMAGGEDATCTATFEPGSTVSLTASPGLAIRFSGYSGACGGTSCSLVMDDDKSVVATFCGPVP